MNNYYIFRYLSKSFVFLSVLLLFVFTSACSGEQKNAKNYLNAARQAYERGDYSIAKNMIDSVKIKFPKAFDEISEGHLLLQDIRMAENKRNIVFCDSMLLAKNDTLQKMLRQFTLEKDEKYQETGSYIPKIFPLSQSLSRNALRSGVLETGQLYLESVLAGQNIKHRQIKVSLPDGSFAETLSVTSDGLNYRFETLAGSYEIVRYSGKDENGLAKFIYTFRNSPLTVQFIGSRNVAIRLSDKEKDAISQSYELSVLLTDIARLKFEKEKSEVLIRYLEKKKEQL